MLIGHINFNNNIIFPTNNANIFNYNFCLFAIIYSNYIIIIIIIIIFKVPKMILK